MLEEEELMIEGKGMDNRRIDDRGVVCVVKVRRWDINGYVVIPVRNLKQIDKIC